MLIEATTDPIVYRWPGGSIRLERSKPVEVEESRALKILAKADGKACVSNQEWLHLWREVESLANGIKKDDVRFNEVLAALNRCDALFLAGDVRRFHEEMEKLIGETQ